jgi:hypothetical protein
MLFLSVNSIFFVLNTVILLLHRKFPIKCDGDYKIIILKKLSCMLVAHTCNLSYSGGRDQEDHGSKPTHANSS